VEIGEAKPFIGTDPPHPSGGIAINRRNMDLEKAVALSALEAMSVWIVRTSPV
jgi:hypothetical protein